MSRRRSASDAVGRPVIGAPTRTVLPVRARRRRPASWASRRTLVAGVASLIGVVAVGIIGVAVLGEPRGAVTSSPFPTARGGQTATIGTAVGQLAPDFRLVDTDGRTITRDSLRGSPAIVWFTTSYCLPCQEGAKSLQRVLTKIGVEEKVAVVIVFVDPGETPETLDAWRSRFGRPHWSVALAAGSIIRDYRLQYLDSKYLLDRDGIIRTADFLSLQEDPWERDLRSVIGV